MEGLHDLLAGGILGLGILAANLWEVAMEQASETQSRHRKAKPGVVKRDVIQFPKREDPRSRELALLQAELRRRG